MIPKKFTELVDSKLSSRIDENTELSDSDQEWSTVFGWSIDRRSSNRHLRRLFGVRISLWSLDRAIDPSLKMRVKKGRTSRLSVQSSNSSSSWRNWPTTRRTRRTRSRCKCWIRCSESSKSKLDSALPHRWSASIRGSKGHFRPTCSPDRSSTWSRA